MVAAATLVQTKLRQMRPLVAERVKRRGWYLQPAFLHITETRYF